MRTILISIMAGSCVLSVLALLMLTLTYTRFRKRVPALRTEDDIARLRSLATLQMWVSLIAHPVVPLSLVPLCWILGWLVFRVLGWFDLILYGLLPFAAIIVTVLLGRSPADMCKEMDAASPSLEAERDRIVDVWINKLFPKW